MVLVNDGLVVLLRGGCTIEGEILIGMINDTVLSWRFE